MRALIVGAGSVGGYFGGRLAAAGRDVTFLVRPRRATELANGLTIVSKGQETRVPVKVIRTGEAAAEFDVILLAVKAYQLGAAIEDLGAYVSANSMILPVLNGMKHMDVLRSRFGSAHLIGGVAKIASSLDERGRILDQADFHDLAYGEWSGERTTRILALDEFMRGAGFEARLSAEIERDMWEKWAMLASLAGVTSLMDGDVGQVARVSRGTEFVRSLIGEVVAAIGAEWRPLSDPFKAQVLSLLTNRESNLTASMYRDMQGGYPVEADQIIGDLVMRAAAKGIATPLLSAVLTRLKVYEERQARQSGR
ncbi:MAG TPA: ketopantoate reductase family protein [Steroidobacteraceae bacterium]|nr:ketopantoate reductase family protein [Steroidobacteraceae bacterium]